MKEWVSQNSHPVDLFKLKYEFELKNMGKMVSDLIEKYTNYRIGEYKNYISVK